MISEIKPKELDKVVWSKEQISCLLESNTLLLGATQTGKSTLMDMMIKNVSENNNGKSVIFEVKGERISSITENDYYVSCSRTNIIKGKKFVWSILKEALSYGEKDIERKLAAIYMPFFRERIQKSNQPYFIKAASNLLVGLTYSLYKKYGVISNYKLFNTLEQMDVAEYYSLMQEAGILRKYVRDIPVINGKLTGQAVGVLGELSHYIRIFSRVFTEDGFDTIYGFITSNDCEKMFLLYDYASRDDSDFIFSILFNLIISYKLSINSINSTIPVYMFLDEISVMNTEIDLQFASNIGMSRGLKVYIAIQSIELLLAVYGESKAKAILEGFNNYVVFKVNQKNTKEYVKSIIGMDMDSLLISLPISRRDKVTYQMTTRNLITDEIINDLNVGVALVKVGISDTKLITFKKEEYL